MRRASAATALLMLVAGCAAPTIALRANAPWQNFHVLSRGADAGGEFCADFDLTPEQVGMFFARAEPLDAPKLHNRYELLPCWIRGTATGTSGMVHWEIRAGGTARVTAPDGVVTLFGCPNCDELLGGRAPPR